MVHHRSDVNQDGILDFISGHCYYLLPDDRVSREIYMSKTSDVTSQLTPAMVNFAYDYTGDGWPDVLISTGRAMSLYVNPKGEARRWDKYNVLPTITSEIAVPKDLNEDGKPDVVFVGGGAVRWAGPHQESYTDPDLYGPAVLYWFPIVHNPKAPGGAEFVPELIHSRSGAGSTVLAGDLNKDGVMDIATSTNRGTFIFRGEPSLKRKRAHAGTQ